MTHTPSPPTEGAALDPEMLRVRAEDALDLAAAAIASASRYVREGTSPGSAPYLSGVISAISSIDRAERRLDLAATALRTLRETEIAERNR